MRERSTTPFHHVQRLLGTERLPSIVTKLYDDVHGAWDRVYAPEIAACVGIISNDVLRSMDVAVGANRVAQLARRGVFSPDHKSRAKQAETYEMLIDRAQSAIFEEVQKKLEHTVLGTGDQRNARAIRAFEHLQKLFEARNPEIIFADPMRYTYQQLATGFFTALFISHKPLTSIPSIYYAKKEHMPTQDKFVAINRNTFSTVAHVAMTPMSVFSRFAYQMWSRHGAHKKPTEVFTIENIHGRLGVVLRPEHHKDLVRDTATWEDLHPGVHHGCGAMLRIEGADSPAKQVWDMMSAAANEVYGLIYAGKK